MKALKAVRQLVILSVLASSLAVGLENDEKHTLALSFDLTGDRKAAVEVVNGIEMAVDDLKTKGFNFEVTKLDSGKDASGTYHVMQEILKAKPESIIAEIDSSKAFVAAQMAEKDKRFLITPYATAPTITNDKKYIFRTCFTDDVQGEKVAQFARNDLNAKKAAILVDSGQLYSKTLAQSFEKAFTGAGGQVIYKDNILSSSNSYKTQLEKIKALNADILFLPTYDELASKIISESMDLSLNKIKFLGGDGWGASPTFMEFIAKRDQSVQTYWVSHYNALASSKVLIDVARRFKNKFKLDFTASVAIGYDTVMVLYENLKKLKPHPTQAEIATALHKMTPYQGLTGPIYFGNNQDPKKSVFIFDLEKGQTHFVKEVKP